MTTTQKNLRVEQLNLIQRHMPVVLIGNLVGSAVLAFVLHDVVFNKSLYLWISAIYLLSTFRFVFFLNVEKHGIASCLKRRLTQFVAFSLVSGLLWGSAGVLFFSPNQPLILSILVLLLAGMVAGSVAPTSAYPPIFYCYSIPTLVPVGLLSINHEGEIITCFGVLIIFYLFINLAYCKNIHKTILETLQLRFDNLELIDALKDQRDIANKANPILPNQNSWPPPVMISGSHYMPKGYFWMD